MSQDCEAGLGKGASVRDTRSLHVYGSTPACPLPRAFEDPPLPRLGLPI